MGYSQKEIGIVRDLAKQYMEVAMSKKHIWMRKRFCDTNDLKIVRPPLIMEEISWHEMKHSAFHSGGTPSGPRQRWPKKQEKQANQGARDQDDDR